MSNTFSTDSTDVKKARPALSSVFAKYVVTVFWLRAAGEVRNRPGSGSVSEEGERAGSCNVLQSGMTVPISYMSQTQSERESFSPSLSPNTEY